MILHGGAVDVYTVLFVYIAQSYHVYPREEEKLDFPHLLVHEHVLHGSGYAFSGG